MGKRLSVPLSSDAEGAISLFARENGMSQAEAAQTLIAMGLTVEALRLKGDIIYRHPDGKEQILGNNEGVFINRRLLGLRNSSEE